MNKLNRFPLILLLLSGAFTTSRAQDATSSIGLGYNFIESKPAIDIQFNRTSAAEADDKFDIYLVKRSFVLHPSTEMHFGSGTETSEDNMIMHVNTFFKDVIPNSNPGKQWTHLYKINVLSPQISSDKNFQIYQVMGTLGADIIGYYSKRDEHGYMEFGLGADLDYGWSNIDSAANPIENVGRFKLRPHGQYQFWGKPSSKTLPRAQWPNDEDFYYKMDVSVNIVQYSYFQQDTRITTEKTPAHIKASIGYRFVKKLRVSFDYKSGMMEPNFKKVNSFSMSLSLVG